MFGRDITTVFWVSKIRLSREREDNIRESFVDQTVQFTHPNNLDDFNYPIDFFMSERIPSESADDGDLGEMTQINKLIVMHDVSGLANRCEDFQISTLFLENTASLVLRLLSYFILSIRENKAGK